MLPGLVPGVVVGAWLGGSVALRLTDDTLRLAFAAVVVYTGVRYLAAPRPKPVPAVTPAVTP